MKEKNRKILLIIFSIFSILFGLSDLGIGIIELIFKGDFASIMFYMIIGGYITSIGISNLYSLKKREEI